MYLGLIIFINQVVNEVMAFTSLYFNLPWVAIIYPSMNEFVNVFGQRIKDFWNNTNEEGKMTLLKEILDYANANPHTFKKELKQVQFDKELEPLPVVLEALSKDTENWGQFFVEQLDQILDTAHLQRQPAGTLTYLMEYTYVEKDQRPFVQQIVDRLYSEIGGENSTVSRAAIWTLPSFMHNDSIHNKSTIIQALHQQLHHKSWKTRFVTYEALKYENLLPASYKQKLMDKLLSVVLGKPYDFL